MADVGEVNPTHPIWPRRPDERPSDKRRQQDEKEPREEPDAGKDPDEEESGDKPADDGHIDVFVSGTGERGTAPVFSGPRGPLVDSE